MTRCPRCGARLFPRHELAEDARDVRARCEMLLLAIRGHEDQTPPKVARLLEELYRDGMTLDRRAACLQGRCTGRLRLVQ